MSVSHVGFVALFLSSVPFVLADDLESLARQGYGIFEETHVQGGFNGCGLNVQIDLDNGLVFVCSGYSYHYVYRPEVLILKNVMDGGVKILIDGHELPGALYRRQ